MANATQAPAKKPDRMRIIMWSVIAVLLVMFIYLNFGPSSSSSTASHPRTMYSSTTVASNNPDGLTPADYTAHFARYVGGGRDPFIPLVATADQGGLGGGRGSGNSGDWQLTGITSVNDVPSALVENTGSGESVFLTKGAKWRGLTVVEVGPDSVQFENALGQHTELSFPVTDDTQTSTPGRAPAAAAAPSSSLPTASQVTPLPQVGNLPPLPVTAASPAVAGAAPDAQNASTQAVRPRRRFGAQ